MLLRRQGFSELDTESQVQQVQDWRDLQSGNVPQALRKALALGATWLTFGHICTWHNPLNLRDLPNSATRGGANTALSFREGSQGFLGLLEVPPAHPQRRVVEAQREGLGAEPSAAKTTHTLTN